MSAPPSLVPGENLVRPPALNMYCSHTDTDTLAEPAVCPDCTVTLTPREKFLVAHIQRVEAAASHVVGAVTLHRNGGGGTRPVPLNLLRRLRAVLSRPITEDRL